MMDEPDDNKLAPEDKINKLDEDGSTPFSAPTDVPQDDSRNQYHPAHDSERDTTEEYNEGTDAASGLKDEHEGPQNDQSVRIA